MIQASRLNLPGDPRLGPLARERQHAEQVTGDIEKIFAQLMVKEMRESSLNGEEGGLFGGGPGASTYGGWFDDHMAMQLTSKNGLGMKQHLLGFMERHGQVPSLEQVAAEQNPHQSTHKSAKEQIDVRA